MTDKLFISGEKIQNKVNINGEFGENSLSVINNNAKYYTDKAEKFANSAKESAEFAKSSEDKIAVLLDNENLNLVIENIDSINNASQNAEIATQQATIATEQANQASIYSQEAKAFRDEAEEIVTNAGSNASWGNISGTLSNQSDLQTALDNKANNNEVVHLANNETISGVKTFTNKPNYNGDNLATETELEKKQDTLVAGENIEIVDNVISAKGGGAYVGQSIFSFDPLYDDTLHLPDGDLLRVGGIYDEYITKYIANLFVNAPHRFCTEEEHQASVEQYGVCSKYVYTEGVSVRLPKVTGIVEGTLDANALGEIVEAGLPNITGKCVSGDAVNGNLIPYDTSQVLVGYPSSSTSGAKSTLRSGTFDASNINSIYKDNCNTVQPQTIKGYMYIVVATGAKTDIEVNLDNIVTDLNGKVDKADLADCSVVTEADAGSNWWYRIWSADNTGKRRYEEGGYSNAGTGSLSTIHFLEQFSSKPSVFTNCQYAGSSAPKYDYLNAANVTTSSFQIAIDSHGTNWWATGYID